MKTYVSYFFSTDDILDLIKAEVERKGGTLPENFNDYTFFSTRKTEFDMNIKELAHIEITIKE